MLVRVIRLESRPNWKCWKLKRSCLETARSSPTVLAVRPRARRSLAALLDLPQDVTPTAANPSRVLGIWQPSLQESIIAAYAFREELDQFILDISINNSNANAALLRFNQYLSIFNNFIRARIKAKPIDLARSIWMITAGSSATQSA